MCLLTAEQKSTERSKLGGNYFYTKEWPFLYVAMLPLTLNEVSKIKTIILQILSIFVVIVI